MLTVRFYISRKYIERSLYETPSVVFLGPRMSGKTMIMRELSDTEVKQHPKHKDLHVGYAHVGRKIQLVEPHEKSSIKKMKNMKCRAVVHAFDVSQFSDPIEQQIRTFRKAQKVFSKAAHIPVATKMDMCDRKKLVSLKKSVKNVHEVSLPEGRGIDKLKESIYLHFGNKVNE